MRHASTRRVAVIAAIAAVTLGVTACSSSGSSGSSSSAAGSAGSGTPTGTPLLLTVVAPLTAGNISPQSGAGANAAAKAINAAGGVKGHPIQIKVCDDKYTAAGEAACAQQFASDGTTAVIADEANSSTAVVDTTLKNNMANIGVLGVGSTDLLATSTTSFPISVPAYGVLACAAALNAAGAKKIGVLSLDVADAAILTSGVQAVLKNVPGTSFTTTAKVGVTDTNMASGVQTLLNAGTDGVVLVLTAPQDVSAIQAANQRMKLCTVDGNVTPSQLKGLGGVANSFLITNQTPPADLTADSGPSGAQFSKDITAYYTATHDDAASPGQLNALSIVGWMSVEAFAQVAGKLSGDITRQSVLDAFSKTTAMTSNALLTQPINYTVTQPVPNLARLSNDIYKWYGWDTTKQSYVANSDVFHLIPLLTGK